MDQTLIIAIAFIFAACIFYTLGVWASIVLIRNNEKLINQFHKFSFVVWIIWLIPMVTGMILGSDF